jgi:hypothetical protein
VHGKWRVIPEMAGAGLWSTAPDLARLAIEIQCAHTGQPTSFLKQEIVDQALTPQVAQDFGLGVQLEGPDDARRFGHGGDNIGYKCLTTAYLERGIGAVVLTNADDGFWVLLDLLRAVAQEYQWPGYLPNRTAMALGSQAYGDYIGEYELHPGFTFTVSNRDDRLYLAAPGQAPFEIRPSGESAFFTHALNSEIVFARNDEGKVDRLTLKQEGQETPAKKVP